MRFIPSAASFLVASSLASAAFADPIQIVVVPSSAPNAFGSPSYAAYVANAQTALQTNQGTYGAPGPTQYNRITGPISVSQNIVTGFPSWMGQANPTGAYASELGNRVLFGVDIKAATGQKISISQMSFNAVSTDPGNTLGFGFLAGSYNYSLDYQGWNYGVDLTRGTPDDVFITSGDSTQLVNEIVGRGSGNAWAAYDTTPGATRQDKINNAVAGIYGGGFDFTGTYSLDGATGSGTVGFEAAAPLPATAWGGIALLGGMGLKRARNRFSRRKQPA